MDIECSVIIVNYNTLQLTEDCIRSIQRFSEGFDYEIIIVDNNSSDGSADALAAREDVVLIRSSTNGGFGSANNKGAAAARGRFLFFLNSDTLLTDNALGKMLAFYKAHEASLRIGVLGAVMTNEEGARINSGGFFPSALGYIKALFKLDLPVFTLPEMGEAVSIDFVTGADMLMTKEKFMETGGFDEAFFLYYEETDLQKRLRKQGYKNYILLQAEIIHFEGGSDGGAAVSNFKRTTIHVSRNRYLWKHDAAYPLFVAVDLLATIGRLLRSKYTRRERLSFTKAVLKSYFTHG